MSPGLRADRAAAGDGTETRGNTGNMGFQPEDLNPASVCIGEEGALALEWRDGHQSRIDPKVLRNSCPCAGCREVRASVGELPCGPAEGSPALELQGWERVGRYALLLIWGDGHATGIYPWALLRSLCGCFACRMEGET